MPPRSKPASKPARPTTSGVKKAHRYRPGTVVKREIAKLQKSTDQLLHEGPFRAFVNDILARDPTGALAQLPDSLKNALRFGREARFALMQAVEEFILKSSAAAEKVKSLSTKRVTVMDKDFDAALTVAGFAPGDAAFRLAVAEYANTGGGGDVLSRPARAGGASSSRGHRSGGAGAGRGRRATAARARSVSPSYSGSEASNSASRSPSPSASVSGSRSNSRSRTAGNSYSSRSRSASASASASYSRSASPAPRRSSDRRGGAGMFSKPSKGKGKGKGKASVSYGKGKGKGKAAYVAVRHLKRRAVLDDLNKTLKRPYLRRIFRRANVKRIQGLVYAKVQLLAQAAAAIIIKHILIHVEHDRKKTASIIHVTRGLKSLGLSILFAGLPDKKKSGSGVRD